MSEPGAVYNAWRGEAEARPEKLPARAFNLARRVLQLERECGGRGRLELQVIMLDGEWLLTVSKPGGIEKLGS